MQYLLDTNACVDYLTGRHPEVVERIKKATPEELRLSSVVMAELRYGAEKSAKKQENHERLDRFAEELECLEFDLSAAQRFGQVRASLETKGLPIGQIQKTIDRVRLGLTAQRRPPSSSRTPLPGLPFEVGMNIQLPTSSEEQTSDFTTWVLQNGFRDLIEGVIWIGVEIERYGGENGPQSLERPEQIGRGGVYLVGSEVRRKDSVAGEIVQFTTGEFNEIALTAFIFCKQIVKKAIAYGRSDLGIEDVENRDEEWSQATAMHLYLNLPGDDERREQPIVVDWRGGRLRLLGVRSAH